MIKETLANVSEKVMGLPYFTPTGVRKAKPVNLPVVSCPSLRKGNAPREISATILVTMKDANLANLYDLVEAVIAAVTVPGVLDWRAASVATGTDGHYAEVSFDATLTGQLPPNLTPTQLLESATANYHAYS